MLTFAVCFLTQLSAMARAAAREREAAERKEQEAKLTEEEERRAHASAMRSLTALERALHRAWRSPRSAGVADALAAAVTDAAEHTRTLPALQETLQAVSEALQNRSPCTCAAVTL